MGKIWLKSVDPNRQCCGCAGKSGPCSTCCSGILIDYNCLLNPSSAGCSNYGEGLSNFQFKDCIFFSNPTDNINKTNTTLSISSTSGDLTYNSIDHSISVPSGTTIEFIFNRQIKIDDAPTILSTNISNTDYIYSKYNLLSEFFESNEDFIRIEELNLKNEWFQIVESGSSWSSFISAPSEFTFTSPKLIYNKILASGEYGLIRDFSALDPTNPNLHGIPIRIPTIGYSTISSENLSVNYTQLFPYEIFNIESSESIDCSIFEKAYSTNIIINPEIHPINSYLNFNSIELQEDQTVFYGPFNANFNRLLGSTLEVYGDGMKRYKEDVNSNSINILSNLQDYSKLIFGYSRAMYPLDIISDTYCSNISYFIPVSYDLSFDFITKTKLWYPTTWPTFSLSTGNNYSFKIKTLNNVCLGIHLSPGVQYIQEFNSKYFYGTGGPSPYIDTGSYHFNITGNITNNYSYNTDKSINYNKLFIYNNLTSNRLNCNNGIIS